MWWLIGSMALQAFSQIRAGEAQAEENEFQRQEVLGNAARARADAKLSAQIGEAEGVELAIEAAKREGALRVRQGASGTRTDVGTNFLLRMQLAAENEYGIWKANLASRRRTGRFLDEAMGLERQAGVLRIRGKNIKSASKLGAATTILGGLATAKTNRMI
jgi:hypothetical protein